MTNFKRNIILVSIVFLIISGLVAIDIFTAKDENSPQMTDYGKQYYELNAEEVKLKSQRVKLYDEYRKCILGEKTIVLCVGNSDKTLLSEVKDIVKGLHMVFVLDENKTPGEEGMLSVADYNELLSMSWEPAFGWSFPQDESEIDAFKKNFKVQLSKFNKLGIAIPKAILFNTKANLTYMEKLTDFLSENGIKTVCLSKNSSSKKLKSYQFSVIKQDQTSSVQARLQTMVDGDIVPIYTKRLSEDVTDPTLEIRPFKYNKMLSYVAKNFKPDTVKTFEELSQYKETLAASNTVNKISRKIDSIDLRLKEISKEKTKISN